MKKVILTISIIVATNVILFGQWTAINPGTTLNLSVINQNQAGSLFIGSMGFPATAGIIIKSDDTGATWYNVAINTWGFSDIVFLTANTGLAIPKSQDTIFKTTDGGNTWSQQYSLNCYGPSRGFPDVHFTDSLTGYAPGYKTTDGGDSWILQYQPVTSFPYVPEAISFINDSTGLISGYSYWGGITKTTDWGNSWNWLTVPYDSWEIYTVHFPYETIGYATSYQLKAGIYSAEILKTTDGGDTWISKKVFNGGPFGNKGFHFWSVFCTDTNVCYAVGDSGKIAKTSDGGITWNFQNSGTTQKLRKVFFADANTGYIVGDSGTFLKTINGGGISQGGECSCFTVQGLNITGTDSMELILSNSCSNNVYLNLYVISTISPFDTLGRQEINNAAILPWNTNVSNILHTNLISTPPFGTYRVSITNGTLICDTIQFSATMNISDIQNNNALSFTPNPASDFISFENRNSNAKKFILKLFDATGNIVFEKIISAENNFQIPISHLETGMYFISVTDDKKIFREKIIVQH